VTSNLQRIDSLRGYRVINACQHELHAPMSGFYRSMKAIALEHGESISLDSIATLMARAIAAPGR